MFFKDFFTNCRKQEICHGVKFTSMVDRQISNVSHVLRSTWCGPVVRYVIDMQNISPSDPRLEVDRRDYLQCPCYSDRMYDY